MSRGSRRYAPPKIALGVTGSIAAYKSAEIVRGLVKAGASVRCVLSENGARFITPLTLAALSRNPVAQSLHDPALWEMAHLELAGWADALIVAPATADFIARLAGGRAEALLDSLALSLKPAQVIVCPAMDSEMWEHPATRENIARLRRYGCRIWGPEKGLLASGKSGWGRLLDVSEIVKRVLAL